MKFWILPVSLISMSLCACEKAEVSSPDEKPAAPEEPSVVESAKPDESVQLEIEKLKREIENSTNLIADMEAFVLMERAKIDDDPEYDPSFMEDAQADQEQQREIIKRAQKQIEELKGSVK